MEKEKHSKKKRWILLLIIILIVGLGGYGTYYFYDKYQTLKDNPDSATEEEVDELVKKVGKLIILPDDEDPTVATITDVDALSDQDFFENAKNGDKLLAYVTNKIAILYRPDDNIIVNVAPIYISTDDTTTTTTTTTAN